MEVNTLDIITGQFSPTKFHLSLLGSLASCGRGDTCQRKLECPKLGGGRDSGLHNKPAGCGACETYASGPGGEEEEEMHMYSWVFVLFTKCLLYVSVFTVPSSGRMLEQIRNIYRHNTMKRYKKWPFSTKKF